MGLKATKDGFIELVDTEGLKAEIERLRTANTLLTNEGFALLRDKRNDVIEECARLVTDKYADWTRFNAHLVQDIAAAIRELKS